MKSKTPYWSPARSGRKPTHRQLIATLDVASPQVMFEVKVADVTPINDSSNFEF